MATEILRIHNKWLHTLPRYHAPVDSMEQNLATTRLTHSTTVVPCTNVLVFVSAMQKNEYSLGLLMYLDY